MSQGGMCINKPIAALWRLFKALFLYTPFQIAFSGGEMGGIKTRQSWCSKKNIHFYSISFSLPSSYPLFIKKGNRCPIFHPNAIINRCAKFKVNGFDKSLYTKKQHEEMSAMPSLPGSRDLCEVNAALVFFLAKHQTTFSSPFSPSLSTLTVDPPICESLCFS